MSWTIWAAVVVVIAAVYGLIKRYETRLVLLVSGLVMALISLQPMMAFKQFDKSMTNGALIIAICSAMGFAAVISITKCDVHLVRLLTKPLKIGSFLVARLHGGDERHCDRHSFDGGSVRVRRSDDDSDFGARRVPSVLGGGGRRRLPDARLL